MIGGAWYNDSYCGSRSIYCCDFSANVGGGNGARGCKENCIILERQYLKMEGFLIKMIDL